MMKTYRPDIRIHGNLHLNSIPLRIFFFVANTLEVVIFLVVLDYVCQHVKLRTLVVGLAIQQYQDKGINALETNNAEPLICSYKLEWWTKCMLIISLVGLIGYLFLKCKQIHLFNNTIIQIPHM